MTTSLDFLRKKKRWNAIKDYHLELLLSGTEEQYKNLDLEQAMEILPMTYKIIIILRYFEGLKLGEIATVLDEDINTVNIKLQRALKLL
ncbi:RNA polymerase sigma factor [Niallia sp. NCCP-28]|uniref:RNA polymerase sigma factor n=1 Tax=Niallia sp. NCCP-28 TaxID=2934712 RepID=UPI002088A508|nr:sigma-70 family RNA polymerase sigma factor [Niallia sp. NCCP-28]GKU85294.1 hypothetical protein NCCP28_46900 [Niallia sp. NCCP-28]